MHTNMGYGAAAGAIYKWFSFKCLLGTKQVLHQETLVHCVFSWFDYLVDCISKFSNGSEFGGTCIRHCGQGHCDKGHCD